MNLHTPLLLVACICSVACSSRPTENRVETEPKVYRGRFVSPIVAGLRYESGSQNGVTGPDGYFLYEASQPLRFTAAGVSLPVIVLTSVDSTAAAPSASFGREGSNVANFTISEHDHSSVMITPTNLSTNSNVVQNALRFLLMLDSDGNPDNGVNIATALQALPGGDVNFDAIDIEAAAADVRAAAMAADPSSTHAWISQAEASAYLQARRACALAGMYTGLLSSPTIRGDFTAISMPPFGEMLGFIKTWIGDPYNNGLFRLTLSPDDQPVGNIVGAEINAELHDQVVQWPTAAAIPSAPPFTIYMDWVDSRLQGGWRFEGADGTFDASLLANADASADQEFAAVQRFIHFPVQWTHARGYPMYVVLIAEIDRTGAASVRLLDPLPGARTHMFVAMKGALSTNSTVSATAQNAINGEVDWRFVAQLDRVSMTLRNPYLYQSSAGVVADDFGGQPIIGCAL